MRWIFFQILTGRLLTFLLMRKMIAKFKCQFPFRRKRFTEHDSSPAELLLVPSGINSIRLRLQKYLQNEHWFQTNWLMLRDHTNEKLEESNALSETRTEKPKHSILHNSASGWSQGLAIPEADCSVDPERFSGVSSCKNSFAD